MIARPIVACQPRCSAIRGAISALATVPELPAPAIPIASPWWRAGYQRLASGSEIANDAPATPSSAPTPSSWSGEVAPSQPHSSGVIAISIDTVPIRRGPKRSASTPNVTRQTAAESSGTATSTPFWDAESPRSSAMYAPSEPRMTQIANEMSKCSRAATSEGVWPARRKSFIRMSK